MIICLYELVTHRAKVIAKPPAKTAKPTATTRAKTLPTSTANPPEKTSVKDTTTHLPDIEDTSRAAARGSEEKGGSPKGDASPPHESTPHKPASKEKTPADDVDEVSIPEGRPDSGSSHDDIWMQLTARTEEFRPEEDKLLSALERVHEVSCHMH